MNAGRELDALIAEKVMGLEIVGKATCVHVDGESTVHLDSSAEGWSCFAETANVTVGPYCRCSKDINNPEHAAFKRLGAHLESCLVPVMFYSTEIGDAWLVVERLIGLHFHNVEVRHWIDPFDTAMPSGWMCKLEGDDVAIAERADTAPIAICLAALKAVGIPTPGGE